MTLDEIKELEGFLTEAELKELHALVDADIKQIVWRPLDGPQTTAFNSLADVIGYGGAAGGGKTDLAVGKALRQHRRVAIFRREGTQLTGVIDRLAEVLGNKDGYNGSDRIWRNAGPGNVQIEFGSVPNPGDETRYQGRPKDLLVLDEAANFLESQARFLMGWVRTTVPGQKCQTLMTFNPPTSAEGQWIKDFFGPWLDAKHARYPAKPGELLVVAAIDGKDVWLDSPAPFLHEGELITPQTRTFIPSRISDNPFLIKTGYMAQLQALPEPLRSQMLNGDFQAGMDDDPWQVMPTEWVEAAMARWTDLSPKPDMDSLGVDVARGGADNTIIARRHGFWFDKPLTYPGKSTPDGPTVAGLAIAANRDHAPIHIDVIGVGSSPYDFLVEASQDVLGVNVAEGSAARDQSGKLGFANLRSQLTWQMREALDPANNNGVCLPPDRRLLADLCAFTWKMKGPLIQVESRDEIQKRIGRSPDWASAYILALMDTPKRKHIYAASRRRQAADYNPLDAAGIRPASSDDYDPLANIR